MIKLRDKFEDLENLAEQNEKETQNIPPVAQLIKFWPFIRAALTLVKVFTGAKADQKINEIIMWGDMLQITGSIID